MFGCGRSKPIDAIYYGDWVNTYTENYHYIDQTKETLLEKDWAEKRNMEPLSIHLYAKGVYYEVARSSNGSLIKSNRGKWSANNNQIRIQTEESLFSAQVILFEGVLSMKGHQYPLDDYGKTINNQAIKKILKFRKANKSDSLYNESELYFQSIQDSNYYLR